MKIHILALSLSLCASIASATTMLERAASVLNSDYGLSCVQVDDNRIHCPLEEDKHHGLALTETTKGDKTTISVLAFNNSEDVLIHKVFNQGMDHKFFGESLVDKLIATIEVTDSDLSCESLRPNYIGKKKEYVFNPWWQVVNKSECYNSLGKAVEVSVNLGNINRPQGFIKKMTITNLQ